MTQSEFINKAKHRHGDKYDYSKVEYKGSRTKVCIICPEHGEFWQAAAAHLSGQGCPKCAIDAAAKRYNIGTDEFIRRAREVHGNKYDYSKVEYANNRTKVCIVCPEHGEFWQNPQKHLMGRVCPLCSSRKRLTKEQFVKIANELHNNEYCYDEFVYVDTHTKGKIYCPKHDHYFMQSPLKHNDKTHPQGCPICRYEKSSASKTKTIKKFIKEARALHGNKYDYSKSEYVRDDEKIEIICPEHGSFFMTPSNHLNKHRPQGCPVCKQSKLENAVMLYMDRNSVNYVPQKRFSWLRLKREMPLDFYLPDYNVAIECQGIQHFRESENSIINDTLEEIQNRDKLKERLCNEHGIKIYYYSNLGIEYPYHVYEGMGLMFSDIKNKNNGVSKD